jgi:hypothetical protein
MNTENTHAQALEPQPLEPQGLDPSALDRVSDEEAQQLSELLDPRIREHLAEPTQVVPTQLQVPVQQLTLAGADLRVLHGEDGERALVIGPVVFTFLLPLDADSARGLGRDLTGGIEIASAIPPRNPLGAGFSRATP